MIEVKLSYAPTREEALENTRFWAPLSLPAEDKHRLDDPLEMAYAADKLPIEEVAKRWIVATTPEEVVDAVRPYVDAGFDHLVVHAPGADQRGFLTSFGRDVLPLLRDLAPGGR
jgi:coenzyme F420-dependent glucose-6-phosphate dehydrogenase